MSAAEQLEAARWDLRRADEQERDASRRFADARDTWLKSSAAPSFLCAEYKAMNLAATALNGARETLAVARHWVAVCEVDLATERRHGVES